MESRVDAYPWTAHYLPLRALAAQIRSRADRLLGDSCDVLDVGCGEKPYEAILGAHARSYVGLDPKPGPKVDVIGTAEQVPFDDESFDCVFCTQVLEHAVDPAAVVKSLNRVLRPSGVAFASTHGTFRWHGDPDDYWRWTHQGLRKLFETAGEWTQIEVAPNGREGTTFAYMLGTEIDAAARKTGIPLVAVTEEVWTPPVRWTPGVWDSQSSSD